jgi:hypothetical protein
MKELKLQLEELEARIRAPDVSPATEAAYGRQMRAGIKVYNAPRRSTSVRQGAPHPDRRGY